MNILRKSPDEDMALTFEEMVIKNGFGFECKKVMTEDGYILSLFHVFDLN